eukprot:403347332
MGVKSSLVTQQKQEVYMYFDNDKAFKEFARGDSSDYSFPGVVVKMNHKKLNQPSMEILIHIMENSNLISVNYDEYDELRKILDALIGNNRLKTLQISDGRFLDSFENTLMQLITKNKSIVELDFSMPYFGNQIFSAFATTLADQPNRIKTLKLRGMQIGELEGKVLHYLIGGNEMLLNLDVSHIKTLNPQNLKFLEHFKLVSKVQNLNFESIKGCDISELLPGIGRCLGSNNFISTLNMRNNKSKPIFQQQFFAAMLPNKSLKVLNMERNKLCDQSIDLLANYISQQDIILEELIISKNQITSIGLVQLSRGIKFNKSLRKLQISNNNFDESNGVTSLSDSLCYNETLQELYLSHCNIKNTTLQLFCDFIKGKNQTLLHLDLSQNPYTDEGLKYLASALEYNEGLQHLSVANCEEVTDQIGLSAIVNSVRVNKYLRVLDFSGIKIRKPALKLNFLPALQENITLQKIIRRIQSDIVDRDLQENVIIEQEIIQRLEVKNDHDNQQIIILNLENKKIDCLSASMKLIRLKQIQQVNFSGIGLDDYSMSVLSKYIEENPPLNYINLSSNPFTNVGLDYLSNALKKNKKLLHLIMLSCPNLDDVGLEHLRNVIYDINLDLWEIQLDMDQFSALLAVSIIHEAKLNKAIRKHLKPIFKNHRDGLNTIEFQSNIKRYFESVVKCWRIMKPQYINLTDEDLGDDHMKQMVTYLIEKGGVHQIQLRRNQIGDEGAKELAKFIKQNDKLCQNIEISRNQIREEGGKAIYQALRQNAWIKTFLIDFGNMISPKLLEKINDELRANHNIEQFVTPSIEKKNEDIYGKLQIHDKGPEFIRCSLKSVDIFKLQQLDLSDNLLTSIQAKKIAKTLITNQSLKILSLSNNLIDYKGAEYLAEAIKQNFKLKMLNISYNNLGDKGIATLILPIAKQMIKQMIHQKKTEDQTQQEISKIKFLDVSYNNHSTEALKHVYALLFAKKDIVVEINDPKKIKYSLNKEEGKNGTNQEGQQRENQNQLSPYKRQTIKLQPTAMENLTRKSQSKASSIFSINEIEDVRINLGRYNDLANQRVQNLLRLRRNRIQKRQSSDQKYAFRDNQYMQSQNNYDFGAAYQLRNQDLEINQMFKNNLFSNNQNQERPPRLDLAKSQSQYTVKKFICGGACQGKKRFFIHRFISEMKQNKKDATTFKCNENILTNVESISQKYVTAAIYLSIFAFYFLSIGVPLNEQKSCERGHPISTYYYYGGYILISFFVELFLSVYLYKKVGDRFVLKLNKFHMIKLFTGQLARLDFFTDVLFTIQLYSCDFFYMMIASIIILTISSIYNIYMIFRLMRKDHSNLLENIERNCKLAYISEHQSLAIILDSFSLNNFESVGKKTITVPKIVSSLKSFTEDLPQFIIQIIYLLAFSETTEQSGTIFLSILLGAFSFGMSLQHALTAQSSNIDSNQVFNKILQRQDSNQDLSIDDEQIIYSNGMNTENQSSQQYNIAPSQQANQNIDTVNSDKKRRSSVITHVLKRKFSILDFKKSSTLFMEQKIAKKLREALDESPIERQPKEHQNVEQFEDMSVLNQQQEQIDMLEQTHDQLLSKQIKQFNIDQPLKTENFANNNNISSNSSSRQFNLNLSNDIQSNLSNRQNRQQPSPILRQQQSQDTAGNNQNYTVQPQPIIKITHIQNSYNIFSQPPEQQQQL